jgi:hypothetical protein
MQGVVFSTGLRPYMWYAEGLLMRPQEVPLGCNAVDRIFCDAIAIRIDQYAESGNIEKGRLPSQSSQ